jgi:hypothetical protein
MAFGSRAGTVKTSGRDFEIRAAKQRRPKARLHLARRWESRSHSALPSNPPFDDAKRTLASWRTSTVYVVVGLATSTRRRYRASDAKLQVKMTGQPHFRYLQVRCALRCWLHTNKRREDTSAPATGAKCAPTPLHHPTNDEQERERDAPNT